MDGPTFESFFSKFPVRTYRKKQPVISAGNDIQKIYYVKKGFARLYSISHEGKELTLMFYKSGDLFPLYSMFISKNEYPYFVETVTPAEIVVAPIDQFVAFLKSTHGASFVVASKVMVRLQRSFRRMEHLAFGNAYSKTASILYIFAGGFGKKIRKNIVIQLPLTHRDVASLVGISRETASLEIEKLRKKGIIGSKGRNFIIKNVKKLEKEAQLETF